jgi:phosphoserine phosphatase RsbU/P
MRKLIQLLPFICLLSLAASIIVVLFPQSHPYGGISLPLDRTAVLSKAHSIMDSLNLATGDLLPEVSFMVNRPLLMQAQKTIGISAANSLMRDSLPVYNWKIRWRKDNAIRFSFGNERKTETEQAEKIENFIRGDIALTFDTKGRLLEYTRTISDTLQLPSLSPPEAKQFATTFLRSYTSPIFKVDTSQTVSEKVTQQLRRTDYEYTWRLPSLLFGDPATVKVRVSGNILTTYEPEIIVPDIYTTTNAESVYGVISIILLIGGGILIVIIGIKRIRSFEIGFRQGLLMGCVVAVAFGIQLFINVQNSRNAWEILFPMLLVPTFVGGTLVLLWAIAESLTREVWREKMIPFDLISKGHLLHPNLAWGVVRGISFGLGLSAMSLLLIWVGNRVTHVSITLGESSLHTFDVGAPWGLILSHAVFNSSFIFAFAFLFLISFLRKYIPSRTILFVLSTVSLVGISLGGLEPIAAALAVHAIVAFLFVLVFYYSDGLTTLVALIVSAVVSDAAGLFCAGNPSTTESGLMIIIVGSIIFVCALMLCFRKSETTDFDAIAPAFAKHITERQRLQQELEIARNVQMSFLPKQNPSIPQFDIASRCAPALEVGGDYYDFIEPADHKLAVAIGDVSGKGTQAAFFMTLTKGFLRALAHVSESPATVLTQVNHLFYENVERGIFISMIYGVFDTVRKTLTVARAGHNPLIMQKSKAAYVQIVNPTGLALGLDAGSKFSQSIEEVTIEYHQGDLFIFYTDGFTEAMNVHQEQFGEEKLSKLVEQLSSGTAAEIMDGIFAEIQSFVGKAKQHDDMTIVVVKVKNASM